jgi:hypothetical protein
MPSYADVLTWQNMYLQFATLNDAFSFNVCLENSFAGFKDRSSFIFRFSCSQRNLLKFELSVLICEMCSRPVVFKLFPVEGSLDSFQWSWNRTGEYNFDNFNHILYFSPIFLYNRRCVYLKCKLRLIRLFFKMFLNILFLKAISYVFKIFIWFLPSKIDVYTSGFWRKFRLRHVASTGIKGLKTTVLHDLSSWETV